jgi:hypothetical protein
VRRSAAIRISFVCAISFPFLMLTTALSIHAQAVPYARSYQKSKTEVDQALKDLQAYPGQKLPILEGFVAAGSKPLDHYERGFYQLNIELLPGDSGATIVRLSAKITAWYADRDLAKSGYEVLASNGRLELDLLDRLQEKLTGKPVDPPATIASNVQAPRPKLDLTGVPGTGIPAAPTPEIAKTPDEVTAMRNQRVLEERRVQQLTTELNNLKEIQHNQAHPQDLISVIKSGTPVYAKASEQSRILFQAAADDEFEYLDSENGWIHISISGDSRGYIRQNAVRLPELIASKLTKEDRGLEEKFPGFQIEQQEISSFPGDWTALKGKLVKIYTVRPLSQDPKESGPAVRLRYSLALFEEGVKESAAVTPTPEGIVVIFDAADGGIASATMDSIKKYVEGSLTREAFWSQSSLDPPDTFHSDK